MCRVFVNGPGDRGSIPSRIIPKTQNMLLDAALLHTLHYKVRIKGKVEKHKDFAKSFGLMSSVFTNGQGDRGSIPSPVIPKTQKMVLNAALRNIQHYKVGIIGKVEQFREWSSVLPYNSVKMFRDEKTYCL